MNTIANTAAYAAHPSAINVRRAVGLIFGTEAAAAPALLRISLGVILFPHGAQHLLGWFGGYGFEATYGWMTQSAGFPGFLAATAILAEFFGSIALVLGLGGRIAALGMVGLMAGALQTHAASGFFMNWFGQMPAGSEGFEYHLLVIAMAVAIVIQGSGAWSVDRLVASIKELRD